MGGCNADYAVYKWNDVWRSTDKGATWTCINRERRVVATDEREDRGSA